MYMKKITNQLTSIVKGILSKTKTMLVTFGIALALMSPVNATTTETSSCKIPKDTYIASYVAKGYIQIFETDSEIAAKSLYDVIVGRLGTEPPKEKLSDDPSRISKVLYVSLPELQGVVIAFFTDEDCAVIQITVPESIAKELIMQADNAT